MADRTKNQGRDITPIHLDHNKVIGGDRTFVIAEIGSNHGGDLGKALETIDAAAEAGADAAKFQSLCLEEQWHLPSDEIRQLHQKIDLDENWYPALKERADRHGMIFFSSPTYFRSIEKLEELHVPLYKLASAQVGTFPQLVKKVAATGKPVILSTGIVTKSDLQTTIRQLESEGNHQYVILHCNSIYPTPENRVYLPRMSAYQEEFDCFVGFSDHTTGTTIPLAAVAMGASVIEKHFILDENVDSPDAAFSLGPDAFREMTQQIRLIEAAMTNASRTCLEPEEEQFKQHIVQRLLLTRSKSAGDSFCQQDFNFRRFASGIDCRDLDKVLGDYRAERDLLPGEILTWNDVSPAI